MAGNHRRKMICACCIPLPMVPVRQGQRERDSDRRRADEYIEQGRGLWRLFRENTQTFLNVILGMIPDSVDQMLPGICV